MEFRKALLLDIDDIMRIIKQAQDYFRENNIDQWQNNYPNIDTIKEDIKNKYTYVLEDKSQIIGTAAISFDGEKTYNIVYNGRWLTNNEYAVIHRMAFDNNHKGKGLSKIFIEYIINLCNDKNIHSIKIDTHYDNKPMQRALEKTDFKYCGIIYLEDNSKRLAFEKIF